MQPLPMNEVTKAHLEAVRFRVEFVIVNWSAMVDLNSKGWYRNGEIYKISAPVNHTFDDDEQTNAIQKCTRLWSAMMSACSSRTISVHVRFIRA